MFWRRRMESNHRRDTPTCPLYREGLHRALVLRPPLSYLFKIMGLGIRTLLLSWAALPDCAMTGSRQPEGFEPPTCPNETLSI